MPTTCRTLTKKRPAGYDRAGRSYHCKADPDQRFVAALCCAGAVGRGRSLSFRGASYCDGEGACAYGLTAGWLALSGAGVPLDAPMKKIMASAARAIPGTMRSSVEGIVASMIISWAMGKNGADGALRNGAQSGPSAVGGISAGAGGGRFAVTAVASGLLSGLAVDAVDGLVGRFRLRTGKVAGAPAEQERSSEEGSEENGGEGASVFHNDWRNLDFVEENGRLQRGTAEIEGECSAIFSSDRLGCAPNHSTQTYDGKEITLR